MLTLVLTLASIAIIAGAPDSYPAVLVGILLACWALLRLTFGSVDRNHRERGPGSEPPGECRGHGGCTGRQDAGTRRCDPHGLFACMWCRRGR